LENEKTYLIWATYHLTFHNKGREKLEIANNELIKSLDIKEESMTGDIWIFRKGIGKMLLN
jgi:hypothetical protein